MKQPVKAVDLIDEVCGNALSEGVTDWNQIRSAITHQMNKLDPQDRLAVEHELALMLSRDEDQNHIAVKH